MSVSTREVCDDAQLSEALKKFRSSAVRAVDGYQNMGNTCYINAVLQCLLKGTPLGTALLCIESHECGRVCYVCMLKQLLKGEHVIPAICRHISHVSKGLRQLAQEDAHEFYRHLLDTLNLSYLNEYKRETGVRCPNVEQTTLPNRLFSGQYASRVTCLKDHSSTVKQPFLDLSLRLSNETSTLEEAIRETAAPDPISDYECEQCRAKVSAMKVIELHTMPPVLAVHLQRFEHTAYGVRKRDKKLQYPRTLDVSDILAEGVTCPVTKYSLVAIILHQGATANSGHYTCAVNQRGNWVYYNDSMHEEVTEKAVLQQAPYLLFYLRNDILPTPSRLDRPRQPRSSVMKRPYQTEELARGFATVEEESKRRRTLPAQTRTKSTRGCEEKEKEERAKLITEAAEERKYEMNMYRSGKRKLAERQGAERQGGSRPLQQLHGHLGKPGKKTQKLNRGAPLALRPRPNDSTAPPVVGHTPGPTHELAPTTTAHYAFLIHKEHLGNDYKVLSGLLENALRCAVKDAGGKVEELEVRLFQKKQSNGDTISPKVRIKGKGLPRMLKLRHKDINLQVWHAGTHGEEQFESSLSDPPESQPTQDTETQDTQEVGPDGVVKRGMLPQIVEAVGKQVNECAAREVLSKIKSNADYLLSKEHPSWVIQQGQMFLNGLKTQAFDVLVNELRTIVRKLTNDDSHLFHSSPEM